MLRPPVREDCLFWLGCLLLNWFEMELKDILGLCLVDWGSLSFEQASVVVADVSSWTCAKMV